MIVHLGLEELWGFPGGSVVKNLPAMKKTCVWSPSWEDPLEKEMATHSSILAWRIPWTEETGGLQSIALQRVRHDWSDLAGVHAIYFIRKVFFFFFNPNIHKYLLFVSFLLITILTDVRWYLTVILICISLMINDVVHLFICLLVTVCLLWENVDSSSLPM